MDENKENQDGSAKEESGGKTTTTEGQSEMNQPQDEDPLKKAFQSALNQNVADSELETKEKVVTDGNAMTARDDGAPAQEGAAEGAAAAEKAPPSDNEDESTPGTAPTPAAQPTQGGSPLGTPPGKPPKLNLLAKTALQEREMTAGSGADDKQEQPSSDTGVDTEETVAKEQNAAPVKKKSTKRKKKKKVKKSHAAMAPPPFYQFPFFALLPQVQAQERRKRAKKKSGTRDEPAHPPAKPAPAPAPPPEPAPKKIEAVKIQQKEDDNGYLNLADLQAEEKKLYGEEKKIGAPGEEYICLADANDAAAPPASAGTKDSGSKDTTTSVQISGSGKGSKPPEPSKPTAAAGAAKSPLPKDEFQDAVLTPRPGAKPAPANKGTPPPKEAKKTSMTNDASLSRKRRDVKQGGAATPRPGAPVVPRPAAHQPAPVTSVGPNRHKPVRHGTKEVPDAKTPVKVVMQPTKRKVAAPVIPVRPPSATDKKGVQYSNGKNNPPKGGTRR